MYQLRLLQSFIIFLNLFVSASVYAAGEMINDENQKVCLELEDDNEDENSEYDNKDITIPSESESSYSSYLDTSEQFVSSSLNSLAIYLDEFFANEQVAYESSGSTIRLSSYVIFNEGGQVSNPTNIDFLLRLPTTEEKLQFVIESDSTEEDDNSKQTVQSSTTVSDDNKEYFAGLKAKLKGTEHWQFSTASGLRYTTSLDPFIRFNMDWRDKIGKWNLHWNENPYWSNSTGWGLNSLFIFEKSLSKDILFRSSSLAHWTAVLDRFNLSQVFSVSQVLTDKSALSYQAGVYGVSKPTISTTNFLISSNYRKNIYKDYLFFEVTPQINYPATTNFFPEYSLALKLDMIFKD